MNSQARYVFCVSMDVQPDKEALFNEVYDTEHAPHMLTVPGVVAATRLRLMPARVIVGGVMKDILLDDEPAYMAMYELTSAEVLHSEAWAQAIDAGRFASEVRPFTRNRRLVLREVIGTATGAARDA